jgi:FAD/FMN-containing dehydrogenase
MVVHVEPMLPMQALVAATLPHGMLPRVLPEFKHITVGGAIMGAALESSSHMHGDFLDGCRRVELLLGDGSVAWCSRTERTDLFDALSGSYGTLGLLLSAEIECQPAFPLLEIKYRLYPSVDEGVAALQALCGPVGRGSGSSHAPFIDALALQLSRNANATAKYSHVLVVTADYPEVTRALPLPAAAAKGAATPRRGEDTRAAPAPTNVSLDKAWGLWFFEHASRVAARLAEQHAVERRRAAAAASSEGHSPPHRPPEHTELADTESYLFRYICGAHTYILILGPCRLCCQHAVPFPV